MEKGILFHPNIPTQHPARLPSPGSANSSQLAHEAKELQGESVQGPTGMVRRLGGEVGETLARQSLQYKHTPPRDATQ